MKPNIIITACNQKYGDFLINHWLKSIKTNVNLTNIDIAVIDYGLSHQQIKILKEQNIKLIKGTHKGHIVNLRFIDAGNFLNKTKYEQVLFVDGGDIIFQGDVSDLFNENTDSFRVVRIDMEVMFFEAFITRNFPSKLKIELWKVLQNKPVLNAGMILAQRGKFIRLCKQIESLSYNKQSYGPDQIIVNYFLYQEKIYLLNKTYNFMLGTENEGFMIRNGVFYRKNGEKIVIVHNAGHDSLLRPIDKFGFGKEFNRLKFGVYYGRIIIFRVLGLIRKFQLTFVKAY